MLDDNPNDTPNNTVNEAAGGSPDESPAEATSKPPRKTAARKAPAKKAPAKKTTTRKTAAKKAAVAASAEEAPLVPAADTAAADAVPGAPGGGAPEGGAPESGAEGPAPAKKTARKTAAKKTTTTRRSATKKAAATPSEPPAADEPSADTAPAGEQADQAPDGPSGTIPLFQAPEPVKAPARRTRKTAAVRAAEAAAAQAAAAALPSGVDAELPAQPAEGATEPGSDQEAAEQTGQPQRRSRGRGGRGRGARAAQATEVEPEAEVGPEAEADELTEDETTAADTTDDTADDTGGAEDGTDEGAEDDSDEGTPSRRRRRRGGRRRRKAGEGQGEDSDEEQGDQSADSDENGDADSDEGDSSSSSSRRRRRRRRSGDDNGDGSDDPDNTVVRVRRTRSAEDQITALAGSTRLEAKKQRRREGREAGRRRAPIVSEAEFLARREAVERVMVIRQRKDLTQIAVLEDKVLVEHYVARESQTSLIGNVYLGRVQNVLPSMEAAFIDIGKGRNAVLYAGEVNWSALGHKEGQPRKIESVLSSGQAVLVQVTKDPVGHKGARLTSQISLAGRFLVYVPDGTTSGISRKLPDTERNRLKSLLKDIVPDTAGVIVRTAAEGASEDELTRDVERLKARWEDIEAKSRGNAPQMLYGEPDLTLKVVRDLFTEDFVKLVIEGDDAWDTVQGYVSHVAPDLQERLERYQPDDGSGKDVFAAYRIEEQIAKGLDRKVWLPSGGSLIIDRTEAMTVVDVNTGKFTGSGGNLEETVTKNNLEAAEEIVRQLRLRDIGGIIVVDFIDMVLESNRDLVVRRLVECLGRDRTRHQVAEVTSLGLVQMTRKRIGTGLLESFSHDCEHCQGRGVVVQSAPVEPRSGDDEGRRGARRGRGGRGEKGTENGGDRSGDKPAARSGRSDQSAPSSAVPSPKVVAAMAKPENAEKAGGAPAEAPVEAPVEAAVEAPVAAPVEASAPTAAEPAVAEQPKVVTRTRRRAASRPAAAPAETPVDAPSAAPVEAAEAPVEAAEAPVEAPEAPAPTAAEPAVAEQPKVVTRTRRRAASRPAAAPAETPVAAPVETPVETPAETPVAAPVAAPAEVPVAAPVAARVAAPEKPKVVTRTRRRAASRPAGPPTDAAGGTSAGAAGETVDPLPESHVEHVPVKKKGARKR